MEEVAALILNKKVQRKDQMTSDFKLRIPIWDHPKKKRNQK